MPGLQKIRTSSAKIYKMSDKLDITMYSLASYAVFDWSHVIIKYELADKTKTELFENFIKTLFPKAIVIRGRSDNQQKFKESVALIKKLGDEWVFYAGNNDHPFIASETGTLQRCLE
ncbi:MAG: hypothetical protein V1863_01085, partial [Candidatus Omnitrophota bacterium]